MNLSEYDYKFPESAVAMFPPEKRGTSRLFIIYTQTGEIVIDQYEQLDQHITKKDVLVRNITKVFHARLFGEMHLKNGKVKVNQEVFLTEPHAQSLDEYVKRQYVPEAKGFRLEFMAAFRGVKIEEIESITFANDLQLTTIQKLDDSFVGIFSKAHGELTVDELFAIFEKTGKVPLPPYIKRDTITADDVRYQTVFAEKLGSVAAPTASLNFTKTLEKRLVEQGTEILDVTLHVGRGTFMPLREERVENNILHEEPYYVSKKTLASLRKAKKSLRRVIALGTTATRTLETIASFALEGAEARDVLAETRLFIYPPYQFQLVDGLLTNFHFPKSSLITLVDAFLQWKQSKLTWQEIYEFAIKNDARLFSYGDSMLIL